MEAPGLLSAGQAEEARQAVWRELARVALPDSRFHYDFSAFIPDFEGSVSCAERVRALPAYQSGELLFITPDNSTEALRRAAMADGRPFLMTTYGIVRGFLYLDPSRVPAAERRYAATLDGMDRYAQPVTLTAMRSLPPVGLLVTGGSAVATSGVRFGKGHGYFDLEWALLSEAGCVADGAEIADVVHECQVVDGDLAAQEHDVPVDWIVTPSRTLRVTGVARAPGRVRWELLDGSPLAAVPPVAELRALRAVATDAVSAAERPT